MSSSECLSALFEMFRDYFVFMMPIFAGCAGLNIVLNWLWSITFRPFNH